MKPKTAKEFVKSLEEFLKAVEANQIVREKITDPEVLTQLFRFWWMDSRDIEIVTEAERQVKEDDDPWGLLGRDED